MNTLVNALTNTQNETARTANGAETLASSLNANTDFFFLAGAMRGKDMTQVWEKAFSEDENVAARIALWARDVRGGAGERQSFRNFLQWAVNRKPALLSRLLPKVAEVGRWDDLLVLIGTRFQSNVIELIENALEQKNGLCAKWMPRQGEVAAILRKAMGYSPKAWRKLLVSLTNVVETQMCANNWTAIKFEQVPSRAFSIYRNAFKRHEPLRFDQFIDRAEKGEVKINASAIFPHDILYNVMNDHSDRASVQQWNNLPDYTEGKEENLLVMADVSGSMGGMYKGANGPAPMLVSVTLALYTSERLRGAFKDCFLTFSSNPQFVRVTGDIRSRVEQISRSQWQMSTDLQAAFWLILHTATRNNVPQSDMPTKIVIVSDMEFNRCVEGGTNYDNIRSKYEEAGYKLPQVVFWNVNGRPGNVPVRYDTSGAALISGYNPTILKSLLEGDVKSPQQFMLDVVMSSRYDF